jgi:hypothetical protein
MIEHVVLFKPKPEATQEQREALRDGLLALREKVPGIVAASCGFNFSDRAQGHDIGFVVRFVDRAALAAYLPHPEHQKVVQECWRPIADSALVVDFEV